jgi:starch synthase
MHTNPSPSDLRFEVAVSGNDYLEILAHFRGQPTIASSSHRSVNALIEVDPISNIFTVTRLGRHRLPKALEIRTGSQTYQNLTQTISREVQQGLIDPKGEPTIAHQLQQIVELCPHVSSHTLHINPLDLEIKEPARFTHKSRGTAITLSTLAQLAPSILLDVDDSPTLVIPANETPLHTYATEALRQTLRQSSPLATHVMGNTVELHHSLLLSPMPAGLSVELYIHWGSYDELAPAWSSDLITTVTTCETTQQVPIYYRAHVQSQGFYGATLFAQIQGTAEQIWLGAPGASDATFRILQDSNQSAHEYYSDNQSMRHGAQKALKDGLTDTNQLPTSLLEVSKQNPTISLGGLLADAITEVNADESAVLGALPQDSAFRSVVERIASSYGMSELVFASPEGPQAAAGGLAQVMSGLPPELARIGIPVSIITPLFRYENGNRHAAAESILEGGLVLQSERVIPHYVATIEVHLGPTHLSGKQAWGRSPATVQCKVYLAQKGNFRIFLIANSSIFDRLYQAVFPDEQLRRAITLSRAILETIACEKLGIRPSAIISNDWMTACIPGLAALDNRYTDIPWIRASKTIHMIHNGGADYHGRLPVNYNQEDLWPILNLEPQHFFGFQDLHNNALLNLTIAAARHVTGGIVTVSKPYAQQLVSPGGGDGVDNILSGKRSSVYGISNGINRSDINNWLSLRTGLSLSSLTHAPSILAAKASIRGDIQRRHGLTVDTSMRLLSFVGRLAEQKGLSLLSGFVNHGHQSALENILIKHPDTQILIAGPITPNDADATALCNAVRYLAQHYPGRVAAVFDYVSHSNALEIIAASSLFLMPSRFEPGGITQLEALALGTPVVSRAVGGIKATIENFDSAQNVGTGFLCEDYTPTAFANTLHWALGVCAHDRLYQTIVQQALDAKHAWTDRAPTFAAVVQRIIIGEARARSLQFLKAQQALAAQASVVYQDA